MDGNIECTVVPLTLKHSISATKLLRDQRKLIFMIKYYCDNAKPTNVIFMLQIQVRGRNWKERVSNAHY